MRITVFSWSLLSVGLVGLFGPLSDLSAQSFLDRLEQRLQQIVPTEPGDEESLPPLVGRPGYLGLVGDELPNGGGVRIESVRPGGPAERAGLRVGDRITALNGAPVRNLADMGRGLERQWVRSRVEFQVERVGREQTVTVVLGERPAEREGRPVAPAASAGTRPGPALGSPAPADPEGDVAELPPPAAVDLFPPLAPPYLGVILSEVSPALQRRYGLTAPSGAIVVDLEPGSPAEDSRLLRGALITGINGAPIRHPDDVAQLLEASEPGESWEITYLVRRQEYQTEVVLGALELPSEPDGDLPPALASEEESPDRETGPLPLPPPPDSERRDEEFRPSPGGGLELQQRLGRDGRRPVLGRIGQILDEVAGSGERAAPPTAAEARPAPRPAPAPPAPEGSDEPAISDAGEVQQLRGEVRQLREEVERLMRRLESLEQRIVPREP